MILALFLFDSISSYKLYNIFAKIDKDEKIKSEKPHKLTVKEVDEKWEKLKVKQLNEKRENLKVKQKIRKEPKYNCVIFFAKCKYEGEPILTLCDKYEHIPRLVVQAQFPLIQKIKSFKMAKNSYVTMSYNYDLTPKKPMTFFENVECLDDELDTYENLKFNIIMFEINGV